MNQLIGMRYVAGERGQSHDPGYDGLPCYLVRNVLVFGQAYERDIGAQVIATQPFRRRFGREFKHQRPNIAGDVVDLGYCNHYKGTGGKHRREGKYPHDHHHGSRKSSFPHHVPVLKIARVRGDPE